MTSEANYGGRVTDRFDRLLISSIMEDFFTSDIIDEAFKYRNL